MSECNEAIKHILIVIVEDLIQDWGLDLEGAITANTLVVKDLEFASVDIIQLCVAIEENYERKLGFQELLMQEGSYVSDLSITDIVNYVESKL